MLLLLFFTTTVSFPFLSKGIFLYISNYSIFFRAMKTLFQKKFYSQPQYLKHKSRAARMEVELLIWQFLQSISENPWGIVERSLKTTALKPSPSIFMACQISTTKTWKSMNKWGTLILFYFSELALCILSWTSLYNVSS